MHTLGEERGNTLKNVNKNTIKQLSSWPNDIIYLQPTLNLPQTPLPGVLTTVYQWGRSCLNVSHVLGSSAEWLKKGHITFLSFELNSSKNMKCNDATNQLKGTKQKRLLHLRLPFSMTCREAVCTFGNDEFG
jgi:hypothetical protein